MTIPCKSQLAVVGTNHRYSPIEIRERLSCRQELTPSRLRTIVRGNKDIKEVIVLSTCNRTEIYAVSPSDADVSSYLTKSMSEWAGIPVAELARHVYVHTNEKAVRHLISVASGLDSMIAGEQQIQGQVKQAAKIASQAGTIGQFLSGLFLYTRRAANEIRKQSSFGVDGGSVGRAAISLLRKISSTHHLSSILLIGAGKIISLAADDLSSLPDIEVWVTNRTAQRAKILAERFGGKQIPLNQVPAALEKVDAVLTCVSSPEYVITAKKLEATISKRAGRPLVVVDAAVPRNIEPDASKIQGIELYNIDDLAPLITKDQSYREKASKAESLVSVQTERFWAHVRAHYAVNTLRELRKTAEGIRKDELSRALRRLGDLSKKEKEVVEILSQRIVNKLLYQPTEKLKEHASNGDGEVYEQVLRELFAIDQDRKP